MLNFNMSVVITEFVIIKNETNPKKDNLINLLFNNFNTSPEHVIHISKSIFVFVPSFIEIIGHDAAVGKSSAKGLIDTGFVYRYRLQPKAGF